MKRMWKADMQFTQQHQQRLQACAEASRDLSSNLAVASTLCFYEGAEMLNAGIPLAIGSVASAVLSTVYTHLSGEVQPGDMYNVAYTEPPPHARGQVETAFEEVFRAFALYLLQLESVSHNLHCSYTRLHATEQLLKEQQDNPESGEYLDAQMFSALHLQALWRNLELSEHLHTLLLVNAARVNIYWYRAKQRLPNQQHFTYQEIEQVLTSAWQNQKSSIATYQLPAFDINGPELALQQLSQRSEFAFPLLLFQRQYHESVYYLNQDLHSCQEHFYDDLK